MTDIEDRLEEATTREVRPFALEGAAEHAIEQLELIQYAVQNGREDDARILASRTQAVLQRSLEQEDDSTDNEVQTDHESR